MRRKQPLRGQVAAHGHAASEWWARAGTVLCVVFIQPSQVLAPPSAPFFPPWMWGKEKGLCGPGLTAGPLWEYYCDKSGWWLSERICGAPDSPAAGRGRD